MQRIVIVVEKGVFCEVEERHEKNEKSLKRTEDSFSFAFKSKRFIG